MSYILKALKNLEKKLDKGKSVNEVKPLGLIDSKENVSAIENKKIKLLYFLIFIIIIFLIIFIYLQFIKTKEAGDKTTKKVSVIVPQSHTKKNLEDTSDKDIFYEIGEEEKFLKKENDKQVPKNKEDILKAKRRLLSKKQKNYCNKAKIPQKNWLELQAISWSADAGKRVAIIDSEIVKEGDSVNGGYVVSIEKECVVIYAADDYWLLNFSKR